jgi:phage FluMu gp28-like protein
MTANALKAALPAEASVPEVPGGVLLGYQRRWIEDDSQLKVMEKSRRTGLTWAEASDDVLIAASEKAHGGQNVYYIGYNQDMAIEYIEACALWARAFDRAASEVDEGFWEDDGEKAIKTYTIRFPESGHRIVALSSRPANLRGKQGVVVIDEAAFHDQLDQLLKAALALLIWGGKVRVISTHNGEQNAFNLLVDEIRAGRRAGSVQRITFGEAVDEGLYRRVCLRRGIEWTAFGEKAWVDDVYAFYGDHASEELDVIPSEGSGAWLTRVLVEARMAEAPVLRLRLEDEFKHWPKAAREAEIATWCRTELDPLLEALPRELWCAVGQDFGRISDLSVIVPMLTERDLRRRVPFVVELLNVPFEAQRQILFHLCDALPRLQAGALDAGGNGAYLAEVAVQEYGSVFEEIKLSEGWYREEMPPLKSAFDEDTIEIPKDVDLLEDLLAVKRVSGVARLPKSTGQKNRHGDFAIALALAHYASRKDPHDVGYLPVRRELGDDPDRTRMRMRADEGSAGAWNRGTW